MYISSAQKHIILAIIASTAIISGALLLKGGSETFSVKPQNEADAIVVTTAPERTAIVITDSNQDGVPDWQESLLTTTAIAVVESTSDFLPPDTLTDQFALEFFEQMVRSENSGVFGQSPEALVAASSQALLQKAVDQPLTYKDIQIGTDNSQLALAAYGESIATIMLAYPKDAWKNEVAILEDALRAQDPDKLLPLDVKITAYTEFIEQTKLVVVPPSITIEHLNLLNSYQAVLHDITAMRAAFSDPMLSLLRLKRYQEDLLGFNVTIARLYTKLIEQGVTWPTTSAVFSIISVGNE